MSNEEIQRIINEFSDLKKSIDASFCRVFDKIDTIGEELNRNIVATSVQGEKIKSNEKQIDDIKNNIIPNATVSGNIKVKLWITGIALAAIVAVISSIVGIILR